MKKILIANRGEIAVRVIRTAQSLGYSTVAVFSDADADAPHVQLADEAVRLGPPEVGASYLNIEAILSAASQVHADAVHPGYGFLSENADFAQRIVAAGLTWIGPPPEAMEIMGNKASAKAAIASSDVPLVPGYFSDDQSDEAFITAADDIGYPVMVKASSGGGGRGMRLVHDPSDLAAALFSARSESLKAFASDELLLEKAIINPRHVEFQVFADQHGNTVHLGERDCSIQRRHQKVLEEAPSPAVSPALRERMGKAAVAAAVAVNYTNAGTVEFLVDDQDDFYFIEMNTRLQVEHPVTELITGLDLVEWQLLVAEGDALPCTQDEITLTGHAIEVRLYAESPHNDFLPSIGTVQHWKPATGDGIRVDHGLQSGQEITPFYDAMIAKVIAHGSTRAIAQRRLQRALTNTVALGIDSNRGFLLETVEHPVFSAGEATTAFIEELWKPTEQSNSAFLETLAAAVLYSTGQRRNEPALRGWSAQKAAFCFDGETVLDVFGQENLLTIERGDDSTRLAILECSEHSLKFESDSVCGTASWAVGPDQQIWIQFGREDAVFTESLLAPADTAESESSGRIVAPMPGSVLRIDVEPGEAVAKGQSLLVLEAMKMEQTIEAAVAGTVRDVLVEQGQQVTPRQLMIVIEASPDS